MIESFRIDLPAIQAFSLSQSTGASLSKDIPVHFTSIQSTTGVPIINQNDVDNAITLLNQRFVGTGFNFFQCGPISYIHRTEVQNSWEQDEFIPLFSYNYGGIEVYARSTTAQSVPMAAIPCPIAYQYGNPNYQPGTCFEHQNLVLMNNNSISGFWFPHEVGHHFGLFHTFGPDVQYTSPPATAQQDHPEPVTQNGVIVPYWWGRELVIRTPLEGIGKLFPEPNHGNTGDFVGDTPADCNRSAPSSFFPGCPNAAQDAGCGFNASLTYKDYNGDPINPPPAGLSLGRNIMSYWRPDCKTEFTDGQRFRMGFYYSNVRKNEYAPGSCGNLIGKVEYEGSSLGLPGVTVRLRHDGKTKEKCNATTDLQGGFSGMLHDFQMRASVYHNGRRSSVVVKSDPLRAHFDHTRCQWLRGVNAKDLTLISNHLLGIKPLATGYQKMAADADKSGTITTFDMVVIKKFLLGTSSPNGYSTLPAFDQPWRFFPEFIPKLNATQFNANPFNMSINGSQVACNTYTSKDWLFSFPNSSQGFDAVKVGDVDSSWPTGSDDSPCEVISGSSIPALLIHNDSLGQDDVVKISFKTGNFQHLQAFQFGFHLPSDQFELLEVGDVTLPSYDKNEDFGLALLNEGKIATLWYNSTDSVVSLADNTVLFSLKVRAKQPISDIQSLITLDGSVLPCKVWIDSAFISPSAQPNLEVSVEPVIDLRSQPEATHPLDSPLTESLRCFPNPFSQGFLLAFDAVQADASGKLIVSDLTGRVVTERNEQVVLGRNIFSLNNLSDWPDGTYIASLSIAGQAYTAKITKKSR